MLPSTFLVHCACERGLAEGLSLERRVCGSAADEPLELGFETMGDLLTVAFGSKNPSDTSDHVFGRKPHRRSTCPQINDVRHL
jgi:hypothetical protein